MSVTAKFQADFTAFDAAVKNSVVELRSFESGAARVEKSLGSMADSFSGRKLIQDATLAAEAVERIGGASKLTATEQERVNKTVTESLAKFAALGTQAPRALLDLADATKKVEPPMTLAGKAAGLLQSTLGQFTVAGLASSAIQSMVSGLGDFVAIGVKLPAVQASFDRLTGAIHQSGAEMLGNMAVATRGMVGNYDLMLSANKAMLLGLPVTSASMGELAKTATVLGKAMGQDATKSLDDLITALGRSSPMILDNLGLSVKVGDANEAWAKKLEKTADQLTDSEKKMAFYSAAMEAARKKTQELGEQTQTLGDIASTVWTKVGNVVSEAAKTTDVGLGSVLSSGKEFARFLTDTASFGFAMATQMAATRAEIAAVGKSVADVSAATAAAKDPLAEYAAHLASLQSKVTGLTKEQTALILEGNRLNESATDIAKALGVNQSAVQTVIEADRKHAEAMKVAATEAKKYADALDEMNASGVGWQGTLDTVSGSIVQAIRFYLDAGVAQDKLATAYGLTAVQVKAVASSLAAEQAAWKIEEQSLVETTKLWDEYFALREQHGGTATDAQIAQVERWFNDEVAKLNASDANYKEHYAALEALSKEKTRSILIDWDAIGKNSREALQQTADKARATFDYMIAHSENFSSETLAQFERTAEGAQRAADQWGMAFGGALSGIESQARTTAEQITLSFNDAIAAAKQGLGTLSFSVSSPYSLNPNDSMAEQQRQASALGGTVARDDFGNPYAYVPGKSLPGRWTGGPVSGGQPYMVGEKGPEMFVPASSGSIVPNSGASITIQIDARESMFDTPAGIQRLADRVRVALVQGGSARGGLF